MVPLSEWLDRGMCCEDDDPEITGMVLTTCFNNGPERAVPFYVEIALGTAWRDQELRSSA